MAGRKWTEQELATLRDYLDKTKPNQRSIFELSAILKRTEAATQIKLQRIGLRLAEITETERNVVLQYYTNTSDSAFCLSDLAAGLGRSKSVICNIANTLGVTNQRRLKAHHLWGSASHNWKGDDVDDNTARCRTRRRFPDIGVCEHCGIKSAVDRHHIDGNPRNNDPKNIRRLCRKCHTIEDGRNEKMKEIGKLGRKTLAAYIEAGKRKHAG